MIDVLDVFLYITSKETSVLRPNHGLNQNGTPNPQPTSATDIVALEPGQLSRLVSEKRTQ